MNYLQVTIVILDQRDTHAQMLHELLLTAGTPQVSHLFSDDVTPYLICMPYQYLHTFWLRGQPTHMAYNDLCLIEAVVLINSLSFGREQF